MTDDAGCDRRDFVLSCQADSARGRLDVDVLDEAGALFIEASRSGPADRPRELGRAVALEMLAKGAADIIERSRPV